MYAILSFLLICASFASAQLSADYQALLQQQSNSNQLSSSVATGSEQEAALRILAQQQKAQNPSGQGSFMNRALDSLNQLLVKDSLLAAPLPGEDTLFYRVYLDTVSVDSLEGDTTILEKIGFTEDGHHLLVKRKELIVKEPLYERYEIQFFRQVPASLFTNTPNAVNGDYPIKTGDRLVLTLFGDVEKEQSLEVNNQGKVNVSGIGLVPVNNLTLSQAESIIKSRLSKIYSGIPSNRTQVNLRIETLSAAKIFLVGEVSKPGGYVFYGNTSIFQALYFSGGPTKIGSVRNIRVTREDTSFVLDLYDYLMQGKKPEPSVLHDGDIVFLPRAEILAGVTGDVGRPAIYELRTGETIKDLLLFAGRINPTASHTLSLWRIQADGRRDVSDLQTPEAVPSSVSPVTMQDGDSLVVRLSTKTSRDYVDVEGAIWYPGSYAWKAGMTLAQAIPLAGGLRPEGYADRVIVRRLLPDSSYIYLADSYRSPKLQLKAQDQLIVLNSAQLKTPQLVYVDGAVKKPLTVDWQPGMTAKTLIAMADGFQLNHCKGTIRIERLIDGKDETKNLTFPIQDNLQVGTDDDVPLQPGDRVVVPQDPNFYSQEIVAVTGAVRNHGSFSLIRTREPFKEFMDRIVKFEKNAFIQGGRLFRRRVVQDTLGMPHKQDSLEYYQINFDMQEALSGGKGSNIALQNGDSIYIPKEQLTVRLTGEVVSPGDVLWEKGMSIEDYLDAAGGLTITGDEDRVVITYADGRKATMNRAEHDPDPGSVIYVPYKKEPDPVNWYQVVAAVTSVLTTFATLWLTWATVTGRVD